MRKTLSTFLPALLCALAVGGVSASTAGAVVWVSNNHTLKSSAETVSANFKLTKPKIRWEDKAGTDKFEVECKKATGEAELKGGFPGTDKVTTLPFEECSLIKGATSCKLSSGPTAEELPGWPTELKTGITDSYTGVRFSLTLSGCTKATFNKTWVFKGTLKAELKNEASKVKLTLPTLAGGAEPLEAEGDEASLSGPGELEDKTGKSLAAEVETARWYNASNERFAEGVRMDTVIENVGSTVLATKVEGVEVEISCSVLEGEGWIENPAGGGAGKDNDLVIYKKCTVPKPGGTCKIAKESFRLTTPEQSKLVYKGTAIFDTFAAEIIEPLAKFTIEGCENKALNKALELFGKASAEPNNEKSTLKFNGTSGSKLTIGGQAATLTAEYRVELEGGGKIQVG